MEGAQFLVGHEAQIEWVLAQVEERPYQHRAICIWIESVREWVETDGRFDSRRFLTVTVVLFRLGRGGLRDRDDESAVVHDFVTDQYPVGELEVELWN